MDKRALSKCSANDVWLQDGVDWTLGKYYRFCPAFVKIILLNDKKSGVRLPWNETTDTKIIHSHSRIIQSFCVLSLVLSLIGLIFVVLNDSSMRVKIRSTYQKKLLKR